ncbi:MAG: aminopeptidase N [Panacagrimonas sp.]
MVLRADYRPPDFELGSITLDVSIEALATVHASLELRRRHPAPLILDGRGFELLELRIDGRLLPKQDYRVEPHRLVIDTVPEKFRLEVLTRLDPENNTALEGLYRSGPMLCTQCEAQGFSRITYCLDRPDVLSRYSVRIEADETRYPVLLANGNCVEQGTLPGGKHFAVWEDPFPKPCYLFAMVAGDLGCVEGEHLTASGRRVALRFYVDRGNESRVPHAMAALKRSMCWDEQVYGLEYDLDIYMVVAAREFNMGAMENKGLNLFNARFVLASPGTATDEDYDGVESVIAHEYFHNWTGNRVTCRDWFQLSLKEGLTVFRDQCYSADLGSPDVTRIEQLRTLRTLQFPEDAGPTAHPVRPDEYSEVNNLYTATVYEKGAEIVRMLRALLGHQTFIAGVQRYLREHDGSAATVEDFLAAHEAQSGRSLEGFRHWYSQSGTPRVEVSDEYEIATGRYTLRLKQYTPATADGSAKRPLPIPIRFSLRDSQGDAIRIEAQPPLLPRPDLILFETAEAELVLENLSGYPTPAFLHGGSAPVKLHYGYDGTSLTHLLLFEEDGVVRWEAAQRLMTQALAERMTGAAAGAATRVLLAAVQHIAAQPPPDPALTAELLRLPALSEWAGQFEPLDPAALVAARAALRVEIAQAITGPLSVWASWAPIDANPDARARRKLSNLALSYLVALDARRVVNMALERAASPNMSLVMGALRALNDQASPERESAMAAFHQRIRDEPLVLDKWFALEAGSLRAGGLDRIQNLLAHPDYRASPNRARAVLATLSRENLPAFHATDGAGYRLLAAQVMQIDAGNAQLAAKLVEGLLGWRRLAAPWRDAMRAALETLAGGALSREVADKVGKALAPLA